MRRPFKPAGILRAFKYINFSIASSLPREDFLFVTDRHISRKTRERGRPRSGVLVVHQVGLQTNYIQGPIHSTSFTSYKHFGPNTGAS